jgi:hypothetical protein
VIIEFLVVDILARSHIIVLYSVKIVERQMNNDDYATNLAFFLLDNTGSIYGRWKGNLPAKRQRELFGRFLGKGTVVINGATERVIHSRKVCFGLDYEVTADLKWADLAKSL